MRRARYILESAAHYHCISRIIDRKRLLGDVEKEFFAKLLRKVESFSGVSVLEWICLGNHFHILVYVDPMDCVDDAEVLARIRVLYSEDQANEIEADYHKHWQSGDPASAKAVLAPFRARMHSVSEFMKTLKMRFTNWYNRRKDRSGTLWGDRYFSSVVEGNHNSLLQVATYIALNAVRAGICKDPADYRWSGYAEAVRGNKGARGRICEMFQHSLQLRRNTQKGEEGWAFVGPRYRIAIYQNGRTRIDRAGNVRRFGFTDAEIKEVLDDEGKLDWTKLGRIKFRHYSRGVAIGGKAFVEKHIGPLTKHRRLKRHR